MEDGDNLKPANGPNDTISVQDVKPTVLVSTNSTLLKPSDGKDGLSSKSVSETQATLISPPPVKHDQTPSVSVSEPETPSKRPETPPILPISTYDPHPLDQEIIEMILSDNHTKVSKVDQTSMPWVDLVAEFEGSEAWKDDLKLAEEILPILHARVAADAEALIRKNFRLMEEYKTYHESWTLHRQRLERLEAVRARKQGLLGGDEGLNRAGRRGAISLGDAARSDLELDQIMASLVNEDLTNPEILARKNLAIIPDMLSVTDPRQSKVQYDDRNGLVTDPEFFTHGLHDAGYWTDEEQRIFIDAYLASPKQFGRIAAKIPHKTPEQCVLYYYLHKKEINFKGLIFKQGPRKGRRGGRRAKAKGNALLKDLRDGIDEDDSMMDSSPTPDNAGGTSDSDHGVAPNGRGRPRTARLTSLLAEATESEDDNYSEDNEGPSNHLVFIEEAGGQSRKKARLDQGGSGESSTSGRGRGRGRGRGSHTTFWNTQEKGTFMKLLPIHGKNWAVISENIPSKTPLQVRNYFQNHSVELGLPAIAAKADKPPRGAGNPHRVRVQDSWLFDYVLTQHH